MHNTSTYFRCVVTQSWCAFIFKQDRGVYHNNLLWLSCVWVSSLWPLDQNEAVTVADQSYHTMNDLSAICLFSVLLHITPPHNKPTEECTLSHIKQRYWCWKSTESKHFISHELAFSAVTVISESLIICTGRPIWVEPKPVLQDIRWIHKQWVRCWLVTGNAWIQFALPTQSCWALSLELCLFINWEMWLQDGRHISASFPPPNYGISCTNLPTNMIQTYKEQQIA